MSPWVLVIVFSLGQSLHAIQVDMPSQETCSYASIMFGTEISFNKEAVERKSFCLPRSDAAVALLKEAAEAKAVKEKADCRVRKEKEDKEMAALPKNDARRLMWENRRQFTAKVSTTNECGDPL